MEQPMDKIAQLQDLLSRINALAELISLTEFEVRELRNRADLILKGGLARIELNGPPNQAFYAPDVRSNRVEDLRIFNILIQHLQNEEWGEHYIVHFGPELPAPPPKQMIILREGPPNMSLNDRPWVIKMWQGAGRNQTVTLIPILTKGGQPSVVGPDMVFYCANGRQGQCINAFFALAMGGKMIDIIALKIEQTIITLGLLTDAIDQLGDEPRPPNWQHTMDENDNQIARKCELEEDFNALVRSLHNLRDNLPNAVNVVVTRLRLFY